MWQLEALRIPVVIDDLGMRIRPGIPQWISEEQYRSSTCLHRLLSMGSLRATQRDRSRERRTPPPKVERRRRAIPPSPPAPEPPKTSRDQELQEVARRAAEQAVREVMGRTSAPSPAPPPVDASTIEEAVARALSRAPRVVNPTGTASPASLGAVEEDDFSEPLFIPEGIVRAGDASEIKVEAGTSDDSSLGDAAAALRTLKKKRKKT